MPEMNDLRKKLIEQLSDQDIDVDTIIALFSKFAESDPTRVRFSVDASHIDRLGRELVSRQETAVAELVKNGYDADAKLVELTFIDVDNPGGTLEIFDNGNGMTREQLVNGFMRLSTSSKLDRPISPKYKRKRAGRKGIGRFAAQRLGEMLTITTQTADYPLALELSLDWRKYMPHKDLTSISHVIKEVPKKRTHGTILTISSLRDSWSSAQITRAFRYTSNLLQPFPISKENKDKLSDPGFKASFYLQQGNDIVIIADEDSVILKHAVGVISGYIDNSGMAFWSFEGNNIDLHVQNQQVDINKNREPIIRGGVDFQVHYFIDDEVPTSFKTVVRQTLQESGGIRLYRNGFRVLPYGEKYDDWLHLDHSYALREVLGPHRNSNFMGFVSVKDQEGLLFQETSSREGLVENNAFFALQEFISQSIKSVAVIVAHERGRKPLPRATKRYGSPEEALHAFIGGANKLSNSIIAKDRPEKIQRHAKEIQEAVEQAQLILSEIPMLRVLAGMGLMIGEFTHEIKLAFGAVNNRLDILRECVTDEVKPQLDNLISLFKSIQSFARYFDHAIIDNAHRGLKPVDLVAVVLDFEEIVRPRLESLKIDLNIVQTDFDVFTKPMHKSEWTSILFNLYSNAVKSIKKSQSRGSIEIKLGENEGKIYLQFSDNGVGIPEENREKVFDAFFTTTPQGGISAQYSEELTGSGLGLKVVKDIIRASKGSIEVIEPPQGYSTSFYIIVPKALPKEISDDTY
jgi:signal transduction histidine kinase